MSVFEIRNVVVATKARLLTPSRTIIGGVTIALQQQEVLAVLGRSGSGKTVLWRAMFGICDAGLTYHCDSRTPSLSEAAFEAWRRNTVAFVHQGGHRVLEPGLTLNRYIDRLFASQLRPDASLRFLEAAAALGLALKPSDLLRPIGTFSGGEAQRLALALRLAGNPKILVLDEPSAALDFETALDVKRLVAKMVEQFGVAVICVTHDYHFVSGLSERAVYLQGGTASELNLLTGHSELPEARAWLAMSQKEAREYERSFGATVAGMARSVPIRMHNAVS